MATRFLAIAALWLQAFAPGLCAATMCVDVPATAPDAMCSPAEQPVSSCCQPKPAARTGDACGASNDCSDESPPNPCQTCDMTCCGRTHAPPPAGALRISLEVQPLIAILNWSRIADAPAVNMQRARIVRDQWPPGRQRHRAFVCVWTI